MDMVESRERERERERERKSGSRILIFYVE